MCVVFFVFVFVFPAVITGCLNGMPSVNKKKKKDFKEELTQVKSILFNLCNKVEATSRSENLQQLGEARGKGSLFQAHVTVMIHNGNLGQNLQLGKH